MAYIWRETSDIAVLFGGGRIVCNSNFESRYVTHFGGRQATWWDILEEKEIVIQFTRSG